MASKRNKHKNWTRCDILDIKNVPKVLAILNFLNKKGSNLSLILYSTGTYGTGTVLES